MDRSPDRWGYFQQLRKNAHKYWHGLFAGTALLGTGISVEVFGYRSETIGITTIVGGLACMASILPIKKLDEASEMLSTYREIQSLPEVVGFTEKP